MSEPSDLTSARGGTSGPSHRSRKVLIAVVAAVVVIAGGAGVVFGVPGTSFRGVVHATPANGPSVSPSAGGPSFADGYTQQWTVSAADLGAAQEFNSLGITGSGSEVPGLAAVARSSSVAVLQSELGNGTSASRSSILYGIDLQTGQEKWSTAGRATSAANCAATILNNTLYCLDGVGGGTGSGPHIFLIDLASGEVGRPGPGLFEAGAPGDWTEGAGWNVAIALLGGNLFVSAQGQGCDDLVSRIDPSSLAAIWTIDLPAAATAGAQNYCGGEATGPWGVTAAQGSVLLAGLRTPTDAVDIATGQVLYSAARMGFMGDKAVFATTWAYDGSDIGAGSFTDSTGTSWQVTRAAGYDDTVFVAFPNSAYALPLQVGSRAIPPTFDLMADQPTLYQWRSPGFDSSNASLAAAYDGSRLLVADGGGSTYSLSPTTGEFLWQGSVPAVSPAANGSASPEPDVALLDKSTGLVGLSSGDGRSSTSAIDLATGRVLWTIDDAQVTGFSPSVDGAVTGLFVEDTQQGGGAVTYIVPSH